MHSTSSPAASLCFIELVSSAMVISVALHPGPLPASPGEPAEGPSTESQDGVAVNSPGSEVEKFRAVLVPATSAAGDCVKVASAFWEPVFMPGFATVLRAEHLSEA